MAEAAAEVQALLRFLTKDARLPLTEAMKAIHPLRKMNLGDSDKIGQASQADLKIIFQDEKTLKQVTSASRRSSKKARSTPTKPSPTPKSQVPGAADENSLILPEVSITETELGNVEIETNRAPLFLAFTLALLKYSHPEQPLSSRLSIAQAVVSAGAQSKAKSIGLTSGPTAEEAGWAQGQPKLRVMGRDVAVMRRHLPQESQGTVDGNEGSSVSHEAFWGIDLEALRKSNGPLIAGQNQRGQSGPPIHTPQAARNYLLRSMKQMNIAIKDEDNQSHQSKKAATTQAVTSREETAAMVVKAIDILYNSWKDTLTIEELDRRAQSWYAMVRPEVQSGASGWGQRGQISLSHILKLKRPPD